MLPGPDVDSGAPEPQRRDVLPRTESRGFPRLCESTLNELPPTVRRPVYDRSKLSIGLVHIGVGAFHRCHQQEVLDDLLHLRGNERWGECGINIRSPDLGEMLGPQQGLYGRILCDGDVRDVRVLGGIVKAIDARPGRSADHVVSALSHPDVKVISLTITEKGYCHHPATNELDRQHIDLRADVLALQGDPLAERVMLRTAPAYLLASLARRRVRNDGVPTFMSCDNVPDNGLLLGSVVAEIADEVDPSMGEWVRSNVIVPNTMVDRIVPATQPADLLTFTELTGLHDAGVVTGEPFLDWVIEDRFVTDRPPWEAVGVRLVDDVRPFEEMKFRVVNATQSLLSYLGFLAGHELMAEVVAEQRFRDLANRLFDQEIASTLRVPPSVDTGSYHRALMGRLANPAVRHRTQQVATDGSAKIPQRFLSPLRERSTRGEPSPVLTLGVAAWMRYASAIDEAGAPITVSDPLSAQLVAIAARADGRVDDLVHGYLALRPVFALDLAENPVFVDGLRDTLRRLMESGVRNTVDDILATTNKTDK